MKENKLNGLGRQAKEASFLLAEKSSQEKNTLLIDLAQALLDAEGQICSANHQDLEAAEENGASSAMLDRLTLNPERLCALAADVVSVSALPDPIGEIVEGRFLKNGLSLVRQRVPLGVLAVIYEARPNVTVDIAALCLKTGNAVILRGGKETAHTNRILVSIIQKTLVAHGLSEYTVQSVDNPDRALILDLLHLDAYVDMLIPRGGKALQQLCREESHMPVILGGIGVCHIMVDADADLPKALALIENAKLQRPSVCNAVETVLIHSSVAAEFIPMLVDRLGSQKTIFHATTEALPFFPAAASVYAVTEEELSNEWLSRDLNVHVLNGLDEAITHIHRYGSAHSEAILTENMRNAELFVRAVDAAAVFVNASTRFHDGGQFGLGAEVAVSTQKLHARGPVSLEGLTSFKWICRGNYDVRE